MHTPSSPFPDLLFTFPPGQPMHPSHGHLGHQYYNFARMNLQPGPSTDGAHSAFVKTLYAFTVSHIYLSTLSSLLAFLNEEYVLVNDIHAPVFLALPRTWPNAV